MTAKKARTSAGAARVLLPKSRTGIDGFDELTGGGLPTARPTLVTGPAGSGKSLFCVQFLVNGATRFGEPGVFVAFEESRADLVANTGSLGFDLEGLERDGKLVIDAINLEPSTITESGTFDLEALMVRLAWAVDKIGAKRVAIDTVEALFSAFSRNPDLIRAELRRLFRWLKDRGLTAVITGERGESTLTRHGMEEFLADCVILLDHRVVEEVSTRRLRVVKYRGSVHGSNEYPFLIGADGLQVLPITSMSTTRQVSSARISTGVPGLDEMLGGLGIFESGTVLISGQAGTGKTTLAASMAAAACARGDRVLYFSFEETPASIVRNLTSVGLDLEHWIERGLLQIHSEHPTTLGLENHLSVMQHLVGQFAPALVVIDPLSSLARGGAAVDATAVVVRQVNFLQSRGVTAVVTWLAETDNGYGTSQHVASGVDTWIRVLTLEGSGERNRGLYVLKSRGMAHSNQIREFLISDDGIELVPVYIGPGGVLTGSARRAQEAAEGSVAAELDTREAALTEQLGAHRSALQGHLAALQADLGVEQDLTRQLIDATQSRRGSVRAARVEQGRDRTATPQPRPAESAP
jgi:circadian clock protein KaiC